MVDVVERKPEGIVSPKGKRSPWVLFLWPAALLLTLAVIWTTGYVYWQVRISRAIADLKREPAKYFETPHHKNADLLLIGSRGFHRLFAELDDAVDRGDEDRAAALTCGIADLVEGAWRGYGKNVDESVLPFRVRESLSEMRESCHEFAREWPNIRDAYPPWWQWWTGTRKAR